MLQPWLNTLPTENKLKIVINFCCWSVFYTVFINNRKTLIASLTVCIKSALKINLDKKILQV